MSSLASVALPGSAAEVRTFDVPGCDEESGWLRVAASGICGTDVTLAANGVASPMILGHHAIGEVADIGPVAAGKWGVEVGDRIAVEEYLPCWSCATCQAGRYRLCADTDLYRGGRRIGLVPVSLTPSLWGGNAQYLYLAANAVVHRLPPEIPAALATWTLPLANAVDWVRRVGGASTGEVVVILGPGYHGLAAVAAAHDAGASQILIGGLPRDASRLKLAEQLGADSFDASADDVGEHVRQLTGGRMADLVVDTVGAGPETFATAISLLGQGGRLVLAGIKHPSTAGIDTAALVRGMHTVSGVRGRDPRSVTESIDMLRRGGGGLAEVPTHEVALSDVGDMLARLAAGEGPDTPHVVVRPWLDTEGRDNE
ncbi:MAG: zinc-binding dehydrogenase [Actinophytocola sp.]|nr:zinc-binding dehydrogenase [Actinophytocola sp.]